MTTDAGDTKKSLHARLAGREKRVYSGAEGMRLLFARLGGGPQSRLVALWKNWDRIMGEDIASIGYPLGHKDRALTIGADDSMAMQELSLMAEDILERANEAMGEGYFDKVTVTLMQGKNALAREDEAPEVPGPAAGAPRSGLAPQPIGALKGRLDPDSPITRCYEAFVAAAEQERKGGK